MQRIGPSINRRDQRHLSPNLPYSRLYTSKPTGFFNPLGLPHGGPQTSILISVALPRVREEMTQWAGRRRPPDDAEPGARRQHGIEDGIVLARILTRGADDIGHALAAYVAERAPRTRQITLKSRENFELTRKWPPAPPMSRSWIYEFDATKDPLSAS